MTKVERLLQRVAIKADIVEGVPTVTLECGHSIGMADMTLTRLSVIRNKIAAGFKLLDLCPMCKEVPHPVCNPEAYRRMNRPGYTNSAKETLDCGHDEADY